MKIDRGYTLSQFVDYMQQSDGYTPREEANLIYAYNDILKQPLKKEMFVNPYKKPNGEHPFEMGVDHADYIKWQEAEKKVIFKGWKQSMYHKYVVVNGMTELDFSNGSFPTFKSGYHGVVKTISDLFQATNGELELQNVEL